MYFRISPVNFRTRTEHMDQLLAFLEKECRAALENISSEKQQKR